MIKLVINQLKSNKLINLLVIFTITISISTFTIGTEYINFFYQKEVDINLFQSKTESIKVEFTKNISIREISNYISKESNSTIISGETPLLEQNRRIFLAGLNNNLDIDILPIYKGNLFTEDDFNNGELVCLIGYPYQDITFVEDGQEYIELNGVKLLVKGVIGRDTNSYWNGNILVPINTLPKVIPNSKINELEFMLLSPHNKDNILRSAKSYFEAVYSTAEIKFKPSGNDVSDILSLKKDLIFSLSFILIIALINLINICISWYKSNKRTLGVFCLLGYKRHQILLIIFIYFAILTLISIVFSSYLSIKLDSLLSLYFGVYMKFKTLNLLLGVLFSSGIISIIIGMYYRFLINGNFIDEARGR